VGNPLEGEPVGVPRDLGSAAQAFRNSPLVASWLGQAVADHFATLMDHEWNQYLSAVTGWERSRYLLGI
jgi:glutamine synthetase